VAPLTSVLDSAGATVAVGGHLVVNTGPVVKSLTSTVSSVIGGL